MLVYRDIAIGGWAGNPKGGTPVARDGVDACVSERIYYYFILPTNRLNLSNIVLFDLASNCGHGPKISVYSLIIEQYW